MSRDTGLLVLGAGVVLALVGLLAWKGGLGWFGHLPGDVRIERESSRVYFPWVSMLVVSLVLSLVLNVLRRLFGSP